MSAPVEDPRLPALLEVLLALARQDFSVRAPVGDDGDAIDGIAAGLNMLAEELSGEVASRRELERAHADLQSAQVALVHAGKLAAIGELSAGVAHEVNNPLQSIQVCLAILDRERTAMAALLDTPRPELSELRAALDRVGGTLSDAAEAIRRVRGVTDSLRTFARADDPGFSPVQLDEVIRLSCRLTQSTVRVRAQLELDLAPTLPVRANGGQLGQVVTNLLVNSIQALPEGEPERHRIRLTLRPLPGAVSFLIDDTGPGVPLSLRERIFEPFFTTKPPDVGTGLGLPLVAELVKAHHGTISVGPSPLGGARFEVVLPTTAQPVPAAVPPPARTHAARPRVLVVDDDDMLLRLLTTALRPTCDVVAASSGAQAIDLLDADPSFHLILCDLQMPGIDGVGVYEHALRSHPELGDRFAFATGGAVTERGRTFLERTRVRVLHKPFRVATLVALVTGERTV